MAQEIKVYFETGKKRVMAGAVEWPGWSRIGRSEEAALQALFDYGPRYAQVLRSASIAFEPPGDLGDFSVAERLEGDSSTDFGIPGATSSDDQPVDAAELEYFQSLLRAYWQSFNAAVEAAAGKELRKGPRGGGRETEKIIEHVLGAHQGYLATLGWKFKLGETAGLGEKLSRIQQATLEGLAASMRGELPTHGPRGGRRWTARYFVRRSAWHILDHAWEIEDRIIDDPD